MKIIGLAGAAHSGKDTSGTLLQDILWNRYCHIDNFAAPIREFVKQTFDLTDHDLTSEFKNIIIPNVGKSPRELMQFVGTEMGRDVLSPWLGFVDSVWIKSIQWRVPSGTDILIITDVRFQDEVDFVLGHDEDNIIIHLTRPGATGNVGIPEHRSEAGFTIIPENRSRYYEVINNTFSPHDLRQKLLHVMHKSNFIQGIL